MFKLIFTLYCGLVVLNPEGLGLISGGNQLEKTVLAAAGLLLLIRRKIDVAVFLAIIGIACATLISAILTSYFEFSIDRYLRSLFSLISVFIMLAVVPSRDDSDFLLSRIALLPAAVLLIGLVYDFAGLRPIWYTDFLGVPRLQGSSIPAGMGAIGYIGATASMLCAAKRNRLRYLGLALLNLTLLVLSGARMPTALTLPLVLLIYFTLLSKRQADRLAIWVIIVAVVAVFPTVGASLLLRFESTSLSGREDIWAALYQVLDAYPLFGIGLGHQITVIPEAVTQRTATIAAHNEYLRLAVETGYIGATLIFLLLAFIGIRIWTRRRVGMHPTFFAMWASYFIYSGTDNTLSSGSGTLMLVVASFAFPIPGQELVETQNSPYKDPRKWAAPKHTVTPSN